MIFKVRLGSFHSQLVLSERDDAQLQRAVRPSAAAARFCHIYSLAWHTGVLELCTFDSFFTSFFQETSSRYRLVDRRLFTSLFWIMHYSKSIKKPSQPGGPEDIGQRFFSKFQLIRVDKQCRSCDVAHSENLASLRTLNPAVRPFTKQLPSQYKFLQATDVVADHE